MWLFEAPMKKKSRRKHETLGFSLFCCISQTLLMFDVHTIKTFFRTVAQVRDAALHSQRDCDSEHSVLSYILSFTSLLHPLKFSSKSYIKYHIIVHIDSFI